MSAICVKCAKKKAYCQFIYCFWSMCILIVNVLITIRMPFSESQWCLGKNAIVLYFKKKKCCIHNVHFSSCFRHNYMLFYGFGKHEKAWKLICMFGIWYQWKCQNQFTALLGLCWGPVACSWFEMTSVFSQNNTISMCHYKRRFLMWRLFFFFF